MMKINLLRRLSIYAELTDSAWDRLFCIFDLFFQVLQQLYKMPRDHTFGIL